MEVLDPGDPRVEDAVFGQRIEDFLSSDIGRYLIRRASEKRDEALNQLKTVDAEDPAAIRRLQHDARVAESVADWLGEALRVGQNALEHLREDYD